MRRRDGRDRPPGLSAIRSLLIRVDPARRDAALRVWHEAHGSGDSALASCRLYCGAHHLFTVTGNPPARLDDIRLTLNETIAGRAP